MHAGNTTAFYFLAAVGTLFLAVVGWVVAATWGGNYAENFVFVGYRGYEATGIIGEWVGGLLGIGLSTVAYKKLFRKTTNV